METKKPIWLQGYEDKAQEDKTRQEDFLVKYLV